MPAAHKQLRHNGKGHLALPNGEIYDLCDCLDKGCTGCNFPVSLILLKKIKIELDQK